MTIEVITLRWLKMMSTGGIAIGWTATVATTIATTICLMQIRISRFRWMHATFTAQPMSAGRWRFGATIKAQNGNQLVMPGRESSIWMIEFTMAHNYLWGIKEKYSQNIYIINKMNNIVIGLAVMVVLCVFVVVAKITIIL